MREGDILVLRRKGGEVISEKKVKKFVKEAWDSYHSL